MSGPVRMRAVALQRRLAALGALEALAARARPWPVVSPFPAPAAGPSLPWLARTSGSGDPGATASTRSGRSPYGRRSPAVAAGAPEGSAPGRPDTGAAAARDLPDLVERAKRGDAEAFGELYDRNVETVYRYVYYRVGSTALAEDLVSETFLRALRRMDTFTYEGRDIAAWFITIARNLIADHFKSSRFRLELATEDMVGMTGDLPGPDDPETRVLDSITNRALIEAVKELNAEQQECVVLRFLQGLSLSETAEAMGRSEGAVKSLQYRAVRSLSRRLLPDT